MLNHNLHKDFLDAVNSFPNRKAIETMIPGNNQSLSYKELSKEVKDLALLMASLGIKKGDRVTVILENRKEWTVTFFALSYIGAVAVPLDSQLPDKDIEKILNDSGARFGLVAIENKKLYDFFKNFTQVEKIIAVGLKEEDGKFTPFLSKELISDKELNPASIEPDDLMVILYTSGTTSAPKGVMLTHKNLSSNFHSLKKMKLFSCKDVLISILPLYHSYSLMTTLILPILSGAKVVYVGSDWPERLVEYLKKAKITAFMAVPQICYMMHEGMMKKIKDLPFLAKLYIKLVVALGLRKILLPKLGNAFGKNLRFIISGGAKLDKIVAKDFLSLGFKILEGYGLTETSPVVSFNPLGKIKIGSAGKPVPGVEVKIVSEFPGSEGEIAIKGSNVMKGYYKNEEKTKEVIKDGWFFSGDLGYLDKEGYIYITGRAKEMIVLSSGKNIYPEEIERHYSVTPYVKEMCVFGVLKKKGRAKIEYLHAVVIPDLEFFKERGEMNVRKVIKSNFENLSNSLPQYKRIMGLTVTQEALSRTVLGKIKRYEVEKKFLPLILEEDKKEDVDSEEDVIESETAKELIKCIKDALEIKGRVKLSDSIELDLGVDSLGRVELLCAIEKHFDIEIPEEMIASDIFTVKDMLSKIETVLNKEGKIEKGSGKAVSWPEILKEPLAPEFQKKVLPNATWIDYLVTFFIKGAINVFFRIFYSLRVEGSSNIPKKGPYVLCVNHVSFLDGFIVSAGVPFKVQLELFFIGFRIYFTAPIVRNFVRRARIIPIDATQIVEAMQASSFILKQNRALCIFPEGERSIDGELKEFKKGIGIIARELDVKLVPVFISGAFKAWPRTNRFPKLCPIRIKFGHPVSSEDLAKKGMVLGAKDEYEAVSMGIREEIVSLKRKD